MRYACLIYLDEAKLDALTDDEGERLRRESAACEDDLRRSGYLVGAETLASISTATTVRVRNGRPSAADGSLAPAGRQLSSIWIIHARDLNEAVRLAAKIPAARLGGVEVRSVTRASPETY